MTDGTLSDHARRPGRAALAIVALLALLLLVAVAAAGRAPGLGTTAPNARAPKLLVDYLATLALLTVPLGAMLFVYSMFQRRATKVRGYGKTRYPLRALAGIGILVVLTFVALGRVRSEESRPQLTIPTIPPVTGATTGPAAVRQDPYRARFRWLPFFVLGSVVFAFVVGGTIVAVRRRRGVLPTRDELAAMFADVLDESLDDLRSERDPRKAVIRTYARMERTFAAMGVPRRAFEAPLEYLGRILDAAQTSAHSALRLTRLFERARFSSHEVDDGMKDEAIDALIAIRGELEATR
jgi:hypothetical protein